MGVPVDDHGGVSLSDKKYLKVYVALKSCQVGLTDSIRAIFFARSQPLIVFSLSIAAKTSPVSS
jgi:hypothetical protein